MEQYHPVINFIYFGLVIGCSMFFLHPVCLLISIISAASYTLYLFGREKAIKGFGGVSVLMIMTALINPTFSHQGVTELYELPSGNMLTLESIFFGIGAAFMLGATLLWFRILGEILTADKIVYLFGKTLPILGLLLSMIIGFIPKVKHKYTQIVMNRKQYMNDEPGRIRKIKHGIENLSILVTWMLEDSVEMAKSMRGRGYGLPSRTSYSIYRFTKRDGRMLIFILIVAGYVILGSINGALSWYYYPVTEGTFTEPYTISVFVAYLILCMEPVCEEIHKDRYFAHIIDKAI